MFSAKKLFSPFLPESFRPLLACVSTDAFRVIEWKSILAQAPELASRVTKNEGVPSLKQNLITILPPQIQFNENIHSTSDDKNPLVASDGEAILALYFSQFKSNKGQFLDLRSQNFYSLNNQKIIWDPNGLWFELSHTFKLGMWTLYEGYYLGNSKDLRKGLEQVGLIKAHFTDAQSSFVQDMVLNHVGGETTCQKFFVKHFTSSFEKLFQFLLKEKIVLSPDFLFLGIYLASLYMHLERLDGAYNVKKVFLETKNRIEKLQLND